MSEVKKFIFKYPTAVDIWEEVELMFGQSIELQISDEYCTFGAYSSWQSSFQLTNKGWNILSVSKPCIVINNCAPFYKQVEYTLVELMNLYFYSIRDEYLLLALDDVIDLDTCIEVMEKLEHEVVLKEKDNLIHNGIIEGFYPSEMMIDILSNDVLSSNCRSEAHSDSTKRTVKALIDSLKNP